MSVVRLASIEFLKAVKRLAFWTVTLGFLLVLSVYFGAPYRAHLRLGIVAHPLPTSWPQTVSMIRRLGEVVMPTIVIILAGSDRTWRTDRQSVVDGLSREEYFAAKVLFVAGVTLLLWALSVAMAVTFGALEGFHGAPIARALDLELLGGLSIGLFASGLVGLFFAMVASGPAIALGASVAFLLVQLPLAVVAAASGGMWARAASFTPAAAFAAISSPISYDPEGLTRVAERVRDLQAAGSVMGVTQYLSATEAYLAACAYLVLYLVAAWLPIRVRDL